MQLAGLGGGVVLCEQLFPDLGAIIRRKLMGFSAYFQPFDAFRHLKILERKGEGIMGHAHERRPDRQGADGPAHFISQLDGDIVETHPNTRCDLRCESEKPGIRKNRWWFRFYPRPACRNDKGTGRPVLCRRVRAHR